jgi:acyl carrier protein
MNEAGIIDALTAALKRRGKTYAPDARLVQDFGMDSYALVGLILEMEELTGIEFDDNAQILFVDCTLSEICASLFRLQ